MTHFKNIASHYIYTSENNEKKEVNTGFNRTFIKNLSMEAIKITFQIVFVLYSS